MINRRFAGLICIPSKGRPIETSDRGSGDDLTSLLYISFLISSIQKAQKCNDTVEHSAGVDVVGVCEIIHIVSPEEILDLENGEVRLEPLEAGTHGSGVCD